MTDEKMYVSYFNLPSLLLTYLNFFFLSFFGPSGLSQFFEQKDKFKQCKIQGYE